MLPAKMCLKAISNSSHFESGHWFYHNIYRVESISKHCVKPFSVSANLPKLKFEQKNHSVRILIHFILYIFMVVIVAKRVIVLF